VFKFLILSSHSNRNSSRKLIWQNSKVNNATDLSAQQSIGTIIHEVTVPENINNSFSGKTTQ